jgi:uncharacterized protein (TIGR03435 family)
MKSPPAIIGAALILVGVAPAQSTDTPTGFEAADVHASAASVLFGSPFSVRRGRVELHGSTMVDLISTAYKVDRDKVVGGPPWLDADRFEVIAKTDPAVSQDAARILLRALLADRFKLAVHNEDKPLPVFALLPGKKVQLKESSGEGPADCQRGNDDRYLTFVCHNMTIAGLAELLPQTAPGYFNHPVVDKTGLKGAYDFTLKWTGRGGLGAGGDTDSPPINLFDFFDKQMGIKVEPQTQPMPTVVVDHVNQKPTPNDPDIGSKLPPPQTEFDAAEIRPSKPDTKQNANMRNGRLEVFNWPMKTPDWNNAPGLINIAYSNPLNGPTIVGGEKWMETDHFDIIAKAGPDTPFETLQIMLRALLTERFKLAVHEEKQTLPVYALTAPKGAGKLKLSDGTGRVGCNVVPADGALTYSCRNTTMAQFVEKLPMVGAGYLDHPIVDLTELKGAFDFDVSFAPANRVFGSGGRGGDAQPAAAGAAAGAATGVPATASAPTGGISLFEAIDKQLGLKLAAQKYPMPVIVIDHMERTPTDN